MRVSTPRDTARAWLADSMSVVLDFETTGWVGYAVEVAVVSVMGEVLLHARLNPGCAIEAGALAVHGIRQDDVAEAPTFETVRPMLRRAIAGRNVIAYGAPFDCGVLTRELARGPEIPKGERSAHVPRDWRCAMQLYRQHTGARSAVKLETLVATADHSALGDARACLEVVRRIANAP